ncbi:MAG: hypothetical protein EOM17_10265 [Synergistales bacterium]|nr:hypothetical protein [Synergistales bacterium]
MWSQLLDTILKTEFLFSVLRITAPILFAALGAVAEAKRIGRSRRKEKERQEQEHAAETERQKKLMAEQEEKVRAAAARSASPDPTAPEAPPDGEKQNL